MLTSKVNPNKSEPKLIGRCCIWLEHLQNNVLSHTVDTEMDVSCCGIWATAQPFDFMIKGNFNSAICHAVQLAADSLFYTNTHLHTILFQCSDSFRDK